MSEIDYGYGFIGCDASDPERTHFLCSSDPTDPHWLGGTANCSNTWRKPAPDGKRFDNQDPKAEPADGWVYFKDRKPTEKDLPFIAVFGGLNGQSLANHFTHIGGQGWSRNYYAWKHLPLPNPPEPEKTPFEKALESYSKSQGPTLHGPFWSEEQLKYFYDAGYAAGKEAKP